MAGIRGLLGHRGEDGYCRLPDPDLVYLHLFSHYGVAADCLFRPGILDEYQAVYSFGPQKSVEISVGAELPDPLNYPVPVIQGAAFFVPYWKSLFGVSI